MCCRRTRYLLFLYLLIIISQIASLFEVSYGEKKILACHEFMYFYVRKRLMEVVALRGFYFYQLRLFIKVVILGSLNIIGYGVLEKLSVAEVLYFGTHFLLC